MLSYRQSSSFLRKNAKRNTARHAQLHSGCAVAHALLHPHRSSTLFDLSGIVQLLNISVGAVDNASANFVANDVTVAFANVGETEYPLPYESFGFTGDTHILYVKRYRKKGGSRARSFMFGRFTSIDAARNVTLIHETMPYPCIVSRSKQQELINFLGSRQHSRIDAAPQVVPQSELIV